MRTQSFHRSALSNNLFLAGLILLFSLSLTSCKNEAPDKVSLNAPKNWVILNVKFKPNTSIENREASINTIEKFLLRRVEELRGKDNQNYRPYFITRQDPLGDPMAYQIRVGEDPGFGPPPPPAGANTVYIPPPPCKCPRGCGICDSLLNLTMVFNPNVVVVNNLLRTHKGTDSTATQVTLAEYIESFNTVDPESIK